MINFYAFSLHTFNYLFFKIYRKLNDFTLILDLIEENKESEETSSQSSEQDFFLLYYASQHCSYSSRFRKYSSVKCTAHSNVCVELSWNSVVNTT